MTDRSAAGVSTGLSLNRRRFLGALGTAAVAGGLTGCLGESGSAATDASPTESTATSMADGGLGGHPAGGGLTDQPRLGPDPMTATGVVVAFEDPSCTRCRAFHRQVLPQLESELIEPGDVAYVFRSYPVVYPWGKPGVQALESTYARSESAHWQLLDEYFASQSGYDTENVFDRTQTFLETNTDVDAAAVVEDARNKAHDGAVQTDLSAGEAAGAGQTTPSLFLFRDGEFVTKAAGSISFSVIKNALGL